jgi:phospholipid-binding lipoprotein MlaA
MMMTSRMRRNLALTMTMTAALMFAGCTTVRAPSPDDPLEGMNRAVFVFNDKIDQYALTPAAKGYRWVTPRPVRSNVTNFFSNIGDVYTAANNLLQLKVADGLEDVMRVVVNTVFGVGGLFDVATLAKLPKHTQDFGLTLGHYGVPAGPYLVLPMLGPSTVRDSAGLAADYFMSPITWINSTAASWGLYGANLLSLRSNLLDASDLVADAAIDRYSFMRNAYLQRRRYLLSNGKSTGDDDAALPKYDDDADANVDAPASAKTPVPAASTPASAPAVTVVPAAPGVQGIGQ